MLTLDQLLEIVNSFAGQDVQQVKEVILTGQKHTFIRDEFKRSQLDELVDVACVCVQLRADGLAADIADSVRQYRRASEKQAYHIARALVSISRPVEFKEVTSFLSK
jgi:hypothetical protein